MSTVKLFTNKDVASNHQKKKSEITHRTPTKTLTTLCYLVSKYFPIICVLLTQVVRRPKLRQKKFNLIFRKLWIAVKTGLILRFWSWRTQIWKHCKSRSHKQHKAATLSSGSIWLFHL